MGIDSKIAFTLNELRMNLKFKWDSLILRCKVKWEYSRHCYRIFGIFYITYQNEVN